LGAQLSSTPEKCRVIVREGAYSLPYLTPAVQYLSQAVLLSSSHGYFKCLYGPFRLNHFRWIVPPNGEVTLRVHFSSLDVGNYDQTFNFELLGTRRQYQLYCRGVCTYPYICRDPK
jgi:hypothetical protein